MEFVFSEDVFVFIRIWGIIVKLKLKLFQNLIALNIK